MAGCEAINPQFTLTTTGRNQMSKSKKSYPTATLIKLTVPAAIGSVALIEQATLADGAAPPDVTTAVDQSIATAKALGPLSLVCLGVALVPWASMLTLRFINMVLSRV